VVGAPPAYNLVTLGLSPLDMVCTCNFESRFIGFRTAVDVKECGKTLGCDLFQLLGELDHRQTVVISEVGEKIKDLDLFIYGIDYVHVIVATDCGEQGPESVKIFIPFDIVDIIHVTFDINLGILVQIYVYRIVGADVFNRIVFNFFNFVFCVHIYSSKSSFLEQYHTKIENAIINTSLDKYSN
jgi:hypothetical protein